MADLTHFNHDTTRYDPANAYWMANLARVVYYELDDEEGTPDIVKISDELNKLGDGFLSVEPFTSNSSQAVVIEHEDFLIASFRGTDEAADWLDNVNLFPMSGPLGDVHRGFYKATLDVWDSMQAYIRDLKKQRGDKSSGLWLTGHSLGGAMATLAAADLIQQDIPFYGVYTFGQPRVGDRKFARTYNMEAGPRHFRFQNNADIVTRIPARISGYSHVGNLYYIDSRGHISTDVKWWLRFLDTAVDITTNLGRFESIDDHNIRHYADAIGAWNQDPEE